jgi:cell wall-associated NlpC family hydrolase
MLICIDCRRRDRTPSLKTGSADAETSPGMSLRRPPLPCLLAALAAAAAITLPATAARAAPAASVRQPLTGRQLHDGLAELAARLGVDAVRAPFSAVSVTTFDRLLVEQLGAADVADAVRHEAWRAGLTPPPTFGTEAVARLLGLRDNQPFPHEERELYPTDAITTAEAKHSFAVAAKWRGTGAAWVREQFAAFRLPRYSAAQKRILRLAVAKVGMPYVWGGETDGAGSWLGGQEHGGYDCSGLVWRVFKLSASRGAGRSTGARRPRRRARSARPRGSAWTTSRPPTSSSSAPAASGRRPPSDASSTRASRSARTG